MYVDGELLYVVDRDGLYAIEIATAEIEHFYKVEEPMFLNDVTVDCDGIAYVSDFSAQRIYSFNPETREIAVFLEDERLDTPDGLYIENGKLIVACWGPINNPATFGTSRLGNVIVIDLKTKEISSLIEDGLEIGNLEGIAKVGGDFYITDWFSGLLLRVDEDGFKTVMSGLSHPTDPNYAEELGVLAVPEHGTDRVLFINLNDID
jgi:sugar lactone lactonase YvrE